MGRWWPRVLSAVLLLAVSASGAGTVTAANDTFWVNDNPSGPLQNQNCERPFSTSIQAAVTAAPAGSRIRVCEGTYLEQVKLNKTLTVEGAGVAKAIIQAPPVLVPGTSGDFTIVTMSGPAEIELSRLTVRGPGPAGCGSMHFGIFVRDGANANIHDNAILDIRDQPFSGCQNGVAIQVGRQLFSTAATAVIKKNEIVGFQKNGITVDNVGSVATIDDNTITGAGPTSIIAQNGIQVSRGARATVEKNDVSNLQYSPQSVSSTGVLLFGPTRTSTRRTSAASS
jgi:nitrous oxidase accessory protein NosD